MNNIFVFKWMKEGVLFSEVHNSVAVLQTYTLPVLCGCSDTSTSPCNSVFLQCYNKHRLYIKDGHSHPITQWFVKFCHEVLN